jgi:pimeloyl-ACP methyl ester carboxylesterase
MKLLFIPPSGAGAENWILQTQYFPDSEGISLPGHTNGLPLNSVAEYIEWLHNYVQRKDYRDVVLAGHSLGGAIAQLYALKYGNELRGLILIGTGARLRVLPDTLALVKGMIGNEVAWRKFVEDSPLPHPQLKPAKDVRIRIGPAALMSDLLCCDKFDVMEQVQNIKLPTLIIVGTEDASTPVKYSQYLAKKIAGSKLVIIEGTTHSVAQEKPDEVNRAIEEFLRGIR